MGHASFFCVAEVTCAHLTKSEAPEHRGTPLLSEHISLTLPELTGSCTGNDILGQKGNFSMQNRGFWCNFEAKSIYHEALVEKHYLALPSTSSYR